MTTYFKKIYRLIKTKQLTLIGKFVYLPIVILGKMGVAFLLIISILVSTFSVNSRDVFAATYTWNQTNWDAGLDGGTYPNHASNQTNWEKYSAKDNGVTTNASSLSLALTQATSTQTSDEDFDGGVFSQTTRSGTGSSASVGITPIDVPVNAWSTLTPATPTLLGSGSSVVRNGSDFYVIEGNNSTSFYKYSTSTNTWTTLAVVPATISANSSKMLYNPSEDYIYVTRGNSTTSFYKYSISGNSWTTLTVVPGAIADGSTMIRNSSDNDIYVTQGGGTGFYKYSISGDSWTTLTVFPGGNMGANSSMIRNGSDDTIYVTQATFTPTNGFYKYSISANSWTALTNVPSGLGLGSKMIRNASDDNIYVTRGGSTTAFFRYSISGNSWTTLTAAPGTIGSGSNMIRNGSDNDIYVTQGGGTGFHKYSISGNSWTTLTVVPGAIADGSTMIRNSSDNDIYVTQGGGTGFYKYSISGDSWTTLTVFPGGNMGANSSMIRNGSDDTIYVTQATFTPTNGFYKYSISANSWTALTNVPSGLGLGSKMIRNASDDNIYVTRGGSTTAFFRYSISGNSWTTLTAAPGTIGSGSNMIRNGSDNDIYVTQGGGSGFWIYSISGNSWTGSNVSTLTSAPGTISSGSKMIRNGSDDDIYLTGGSNNTGFYKYSVSGNSWTTLTATPGAIGTGSNMIRNSSDNDIYVTRGFGNTSFYKYSISGNSWTTLTVAPGAINSGSSMIRNSSDNDIYITLGNTTTSFYKYSISDNSWTALTVAPGTIGLGSIMIRNASDNDIYVTGGDSNGTAFYKYSISDNSWTTLATVPTGLNNGGSSMIRNGSDNDIYVTRGNGGSPFYKYSISGNSWTTLASAPGSISTGSSMIRNSSDNDIYVTQGGSTAGFYKYSISGNSWTTLSGLPALAGTGAQMMRNGSDNDIYVIRGGSTADFFKFVINSTTYSSSGTFSSFVIDTGRNVLPDRIIWNATTPTGTEVKFQIRSATTEEAVSGATWYGPTGTEDYYTSSGQAINSVHDGGRYFEYKAYFLTTDTSATATLEDVSLEYSYYPASSTLTSSAYNSSSDGNIISSLAWTEDLPSGTDIKFQIQSAPDNGGAPGVWSGFMGPDGTESSYFTDPTGAEDIPAALADASDDQWMQYKVFLTSDGSAAPTLSDVTITYVVNAAPEFNSDYPTTAAGGVSASQNSDGTITINYSVRDSDTDEGTIGRTPGYVTPYFYYSLDSGVSYTLISTSTTMESTSYGNKAVATSTYTVYTATSTITNQFTGSYDADAKIRVLVSDNEGANATASSSSAVFTLDTKVPDLGGIPVYIDASQSPAVVTLSATDDSPLQMKVGVVSNLSDASWESYSNTKNLSFSSGNTVYAQFKDSKGNTTSITSVTPPDTPSNYFFQDTSNPNTEEWREFFAWGVADEPALGFKRYNVYRSVDGAAYSLLSRQTDRLVNYVVDTGLTTTSSYRYKVSVEDDNGNISFFSIPSAADYPDGTGGSDLASPTLSSVTSSNITTTGATVTWTTNKPGDSTVYYSATSTYPGSDKTQHDESVGVPSMLTSHSVVLSELTPGTKYYFLVTSEDVSGNTGQSASSAYTFTTDDGPSISNVTTSEVFDNEATIIWNTNVSANSSVYYSVNSDLSEPVEVSSALPLTTNHRVRLTGLTEGAKYYFYVKSTDAESNVATDKNVVSGVINYYNFNTSSDSQAPTISSTATALVGETGATITWTTDEPSTSQVEWGTSTDLGTYTEESTTYSTVHSVVITGLTSTTKYYYRVLSEDKSGNSASDDDSGEKYDFTTLTPSVVTNTVYVGGGGGGGGVIDNRDITKPVVSDVTIDFIGGTSATISFKASKVTTGSIKYGTTIGYGMEASRAGVYGTSNSVSLSGLLPETTYHFKAVATDIYKNVGESGDGTFVTLSGGSAEIVPEEIEFVATSTEDIALLDKVRSASGQMVRSILSTLSQNSNLSDVTESQLASSLSSLASKAVSSPTISGTNISVSVGSKSAVVQWITDKEANSLVAYAKASDYNSGSEPYTITAGFPDEKVSDHKVVLDNLTPSTTYHFQVRSQSVLGPVALSSDRTFTTASLVPDISNVRFDKIGETLAGLSWKTDIPTKTLIEIKNSQTGEVKKIEDINFVKDHSYEVSNLDYSTGYTVSLIAVDGDGNTSKPTIVPFSTTLSAEAPKISNVKVTSSIIPDRVETTQTIISWKTDKPSTSQVFYSEGSAGASESTPVDSSLLRDHIVITTSLRPGTVYKISVESSDSAGNITRSDPYTVLTQRSQGSVVDLIFKNLDTTFGFLRKK
ncbi:MAG: hypothetical protein A2743_03185 [Candidatus Taylorbacteria bacterium RIFCSPHIGHO2_01_FULL_43_47]|nr:MAG: hypothetical protein A2743_03185 [Candidatus Taylorbacteria bacterium RIFCSPHIGHO2_01_FULL_43_47]